MPNLTLRDGATLAYDLYDFTDPWQPAETVVLVHGFSKNRRLWYKWIPALARRYRVVCVDQRGHGDSSVPPDDFEMGLAAFAEDMDELAAKLELEPAHWVVAEFSSTVGVEFAIRYPHRLQTLVLAGFGYRWSGIDFPHWVELVEKGGAETWARETNRLRLGPETDPRMREWYVSQQAGMSPAFLVKLFRFGPSVDLTERLPLIQTPTLIIGGEASRQEPIENLRLAAERIPNCKLVVLPGAPFNVMSSRTEESIAATLAFLGRNPIAR